MPVPWVDLTDSIARAARREMAPGPSAGLAGEETARTNPRRRD